jgi:hypothetical protein
MATDEYWHHMDAEKKDQVYSRKTGRVTHKWRPRTQKWPNHIFDCEVMQVVAAIFFDRLKLTSDASEEKNDANPDGKTTDTEGTGGGTQEIT